MNNEEQIVILLDTEGNAFLTADVVATSANKDSIYYLDLDESSVFQKLINILPLKPRFNPLIFAYHQFKKEIVVAKANLLGKREDFWTLDLKNWFHESGSRNHLYRTNTFPHSGGNLMLNQVSDIEKNWLDTTHIIHNPYYCNLTGFFKDYQNKNKLQQVGYYDPGGNLMESYIEEKLLFPKTNNWFYSGDYTKTPYRLYDRITAIKVHDYPGGNMAKPREVKAEEIQYPIPVSNNYGDSLQYRNKTAFRRNSNELAIPFSALGNNKAGFGMVARTIKAFEGIYDNPTFSIIRCKTSRGNIVYLGICMYEDVASNATNTFVLNNVTYNELSKDVFYTEYLKNSNFFDNDGDFILTGSHLDFWAERIFNGATVPVNLSNIFVSFKSGDVLNIQIGQTNRRMVRATSNPILCFIGGFNLYYTGYSIATNNMNDFTDSSHENNGEMETDVTSAISPGGIKYFIKNVKTMRGLNNDIATITCFSDGEPYNLAEYKYNLTCIRHQANTENNYTMIGHYIDALYGNAGSRLNINCLDNFILG